MRELIRYLKAWVSGALLSIVLLLPSAQVASEAGVPLFVIQIVAFALPFVLIGAFKRVYSE